MKRRRSQTRRKRRFRRGIVRFIFRGGDGGGEYINKKGLGGHD